MWQDSMQSVGANIHWLICETTMNLAYLSSTKKAWTGRWLKNLGFSSALKPSVKDTSSVCNRGH